MHTDLRRLSRSCVIWMSRLQKENPHSHPCLGISVHPRPSAVLFSFSASFLLAFLCALRAFLWPLICLQNPPLFLKPAGIPQREAIGHAKDNNLRISSVLRRERHTGAFGEEGLVWRSGWGTPIPTGFRVQPCGSRIPRGFRHPAQGCAPRATLGRRRQSAQPQRGCVPLGAAPDTTPLGLERGANSPRVARRSGGQPWAF